MVLEATCQQIDSVILESPITSAFEFRERRCIVNITSFSKDVKKTISAVNICCSHMLFSKEKKVWIEKNFMKYIDFMIE